MRNNIALFGFGTRTSGAYLYLSIAAERLEASVTPTLGPVSSVASFNDGFITFACDLNAEEYADFHEVAEITGVLDKWLPLFGAVQEVKIVNE